MAALKRTTVALAFSERTLNAWVKETLDGWANDSGNIPETGQAWAADRGGPQSVPGLHLRIRLGRRDGHWITEDPAVGFYLVKKLQGRNLTRLIGDRKITGVEMARQEARGLLAKLMQGEDPKHERRLAEEIRDLQRLTYREALEGFLAEADIAEGTRKKYWLSITTTFRETADKPLTWFTPERVRQMHKARSAESRSRADQDMRVLRLVWNWASNNQRTEAGEQVLGPNPVAVLNKRQRGPGARGWNNVPRKESIIPRAKLPDWFAALHAVRDDPAILRVRKASCLLLEALALTGLRFQELSDLPWSSVDLAMGTLTIPDTSSKNRRALVRPITRRVGEILIQIQKDQPGPLLFPGRRSTAADPQPIDNTVALQKELQAKTGLWITPHDLRRVWTSAATRAGLPTIVIKRLLNHVSGVEEVTEGYIRLGLDELLEQAQSVEDTILGDAGLLSSKGLDDKLHDLLAGLDEDTKRRLLFDLAQRQIQGAA